MDLRPPPVTETNELNQWLFELHSWLSNLHVNQMLPGSATWDAGSIADGDEEAKDVTITGAALGDYVLASLSIDVADLVLTAQVTAADTVTASLANNTGGAIDLASATLYVMVIKKSH
jgi:hypothetical protein